MKRFLKVIMVFILIFAILGVGIRAFLLFSEKKKNKELVDTIDLELLAKNTKGGRENILLLGVDSLDGKEENHFGIRTDTMMILSVDPTTKTGFIVSIPRDTRVAMEGTMNKINAAHSHGGVSLTLKVVGENFNIPIHHYVKVDYNALFETVDIVGGVEVYVPMDMYYEDPYANPPLVIDLKEGLQTLDGKKSMEFLRFRKGYENQDLGRINAQQDFIKALIKKMSRAEMITKIPKYIEVFYNNVQTDMSLMDMFNVAAKCINIKPHNVQKEVVPGYADMINGISYYIKDDEKLDAMLNYLVSGDFYREEPPTEEVIPNQEMSDLPENTEQYSIVVLNGSGKVGIAQRGYDILKLNHMEPIYFGNASEFEHNQTVIYTQNQDLGNKIIQTLGCGIINTQSKQYNGKVTDAYIILGKDFDK